MKNQALITKRNTVGIIGFGAFGKLIAQSLSGQFVLLAHDPQANRRNVAPEPDVEFVSLEAVAQCDVIVIATPVHTFEEVLTSVATNCRPGALVVDVGSVKVQPSDLMERILPDHVDIIATHPLFGPQSARNGIRGLKIAICPIRGCRHRRFAAFLRKCLGLNVIMTTPQDHDREAATVQGLTHLIAKVLQRMGPLPTRMTTRSFDLLVEAISMVQDDAPEVFDAIEKANPYSANVRRRFFDLAHELNIELESKS
ncbi:MAG: prephenate dehydrogenase/arogenate dehydrogenase family protein [Pikeienuella sp.]